jgi:hypothetical protein
MSHDSSVDIATRYGLGRSGFRIPVVAIFSAPDQTGPRGPRSLLYNGCRISLPGVKRPGRGVDRPPPSIADGDERVELYLYSGLGLCGLLQDKLYSYVFRNVGGSRRSYLGLC